MTEAIYDKAKEMMDEMADLKHLNDEIDKALALMQTSTDGVIEVHIQGEGDRCDLHMNRALLDDLLRKYRKINLADIAKLNKQFKKL